MSFRRFPLTCRCRQQFLTKMMGDCCIFTASKNNLKLVQAKCSHQCSNKENVLASHLPCLFPASFSLFSSFQHSFNTVDSKYYCRCLDSNHGSLVSEVTALPTEPPPLPTNLIHSWFQECHGRPDLGKLLDGAEVLEVPESVHAKLGRSRLHGRRHPATKVRDEW